MRRKRIVLVLHGNEVKMPPAFGAFKQAQKVKAAESEQPDLGLLE